MKASGDFFIALKFLLKVTEQWPNENFRFERPFELLVKPEIMKSILACLFILSWFYIFSQKRDTILILPGSKILKTDRLHNYKATYSFFNYLDGQEKKIGSLDDQFLLKENGKQGLRICSIVFGANNILDSGLCALHELAPVYHRSVQTKKNMSLTFSNDKVIGSVTMKDGTNKVDAIDQPTPSPLFDSFYEDILAMTIEVEKGKLFRFPEYIYETGGTVWSVGEILKGKATKERIVKFYELNSKKEIVRTTTYTINESTWEILQREYTMGANRIVMK